MKKTLKTNQFFLNSKIIAYIYNIIFCFRIREKSSLYSEDLIKKILIIRNDNMGDLLCSIPTIEALRKKFPRSYIALLVQKKTEDLISHNTSINKIYSYIKPKEAKRLKKIRLYYEKFFLLFALRKEKFDLCLVLKSDFSKSQGLLSFFINAKYRLGHYPHKQKDLNFAFFHNIHVENSKTNLHEIERTLNIVKTLGIDTEEKNIKIRIPLEILRSVDSFIEYNNLQKFITLHIFSKRFNKIWNTETLALISKKLISEIGLPIFLTYPENLESKAEKIKQMLVKDIYSINTPTVLHLGAILKRSTFFITPDGGQMHLSAALDVETLALFDKTSPLEWKPWGEHGEVLLINKKNPEQIATDIINVIKKKQEKLS